MRYGRGRCVTGGVQVWHGRDAGMTWGGGWFVWIMDPIWAPKKKLGAEPIGTLNYFTTAVA